MPNIVLHQFGGDPGVESGSPFCVKIHRALAFKGLEYTPHNVSSPAEMKRLNPGVAKVPVVDYDGHLVTDSTRILDFLEERHPEPAFWPSDDRLRAQARLIEDWADEALYWFAVYQRWAIDSNFEPFRQRFFGKMPIPLRWIVPPVARKQVLRQLQGQGLGRLRAAEVSEGLERHLTMLDTLLSEQDWLVGDALTAADIAVFAPLRAVSVETMPPSAAVVAEHKRVITWLKRVDQATESPHTVPFLP